ESAEPAAEPSGATPSNEPTPSDEPAAAHEPTAAREPASGATPAAAAPAAPPRPTAPGALTSRTHPIRVGWLKTGLAGDLGLAYAPGRRDVSRYTGARWDRELELDLGRMIDELGMQRLVVLMERAELESIGVGELVAKAEARVPVLELPIPDEGAPGDAEAARGVVREVVTALRSGEKVVLVSRGGQGRTGTVAACVLVELGAAAGEAVATLRELRGPHCPDAVGERFVRRYGGAEEEPAAVAGVAVEEERDEADGAAATGAETVGAETAGAEATAPGVPVFDDVPIEADAPPEDLEDEDAGWGEGLEEDAPLDEGAPFEEGAPLDGDAPFDEGDADEGWEDEDDALDEGDGDEGLEDEGADWGEDDADDEGWEEDDEAEGEDGALVDGALAESGSSGASAGGQGHGHGHGHGSSGHGSSGGEAWAAGHRLDLAVVGDVSGTFDLAAPPSAAPTPDELAADPWQSRVAGAVLGAAIGDALGHPTEFVGSFESLRAKWPPSGVTGFELWWEKGGRRFAPYTDDTQMAEVVLRGLLWARDRDAGLDAAMTKIAEGFVAWADHPQGGHRAPGNACLAGCRALARGVPWHEAGGPKAGGCGSVMRAYPFGLLFHDDLARAERWAVAHSRLTHGDPIALAACAAMAVGVARTLRGEPVTTVLSEMIAAACRHSPRTGAMMARALDEAWDGTPPETTLKRLEGWAAHEAIAAAIYLVARHPDDPRAALLEAANTPGDSDSLATLAGALVGARVGLAAIPEDWVRDVERSETFLGLAARV
ncbi:MAG TPA: ADP-ribosylglycohydrolase family protein, partial [Polyangiaceae bacterium LLY-WYZ-15_(1-7)]|nr:ADP-ribosylglycohydrolase family protein [Polyangiaceae bacterium LLY-WYZ-15_(1-7)]